jgi:hypothetical protein
VAGALPRRIKQGEFQRKTVVPDTASVENSAKTSRIARPGRFQPFRGVAAVRVF